MHKLQKDRNSSKTTPVTRKRGQVRLDSGLREEPVCVLRDSAAYTRLKGALPCLREVCFSGQKAEIQEGSLSFYLL